MRSTRLPCQRVYAGLVPLIVLWDIDHTLIENAGVSKEIYASAFTHLARQKPMAPAPTEGRTDRLILAEMFRQHGLPAPDWPSALSALEKAGAAHSDQLRMRGRVLPGVLDALHAVRADHRMVSSVLTGNIAANARMKLAAFDLDQLVDLSVGAYGADSADRAALVDVARKRVHAAYGLPTDTPVVLIGDTPRDVDAALTSGAGVVAIASGIHSADELRQAGAGTVLPDLRDSSALMAALRSALPTGV
jgi:phosphoglycolate phosphatase